MQKAYLCLLFYIGILFNANSQCSLSSGLIAYFPFSGNAIDASGNNNNGTVVNATLTADRNGVANEAYYFNGTNAYIDLGSGTAIKRFNTDFTITAWVKRETSSMVSSTIVGGRNDVPNNNEGSYFVLGNGSTNSGKVSFATRGGSTGSGITSVHAIALNEWHHVAVTFKYNGTGNINEAKIYIDGTLDVTKSDVTDILNPASTNVFLGYDPPSNVQNISRFQGTMDEIRFYNCILPDQSIAGLAGDIITSINNAAYIELTSVFPNPSNSEFTIHLAENNLTEAVVNIYDELGQKINCKALITDEIKLDLRNQRNGSYLVKIGINDKHYFAKLIKI